MRVKSFAAQGPLCQIRDRLEQTRERRIWICPQYAVILASKPGSLAPSEQPHFEPETIATSAILTYPNISR
jgi:hypothetical protein